ncbi:MAG TPA: metal-sulfur cluster assembly factor [Patescibacteria group bacterium]|nr:metal-sulfur cluster assembly factor [Patescibacteria group bacterium]
MHHKSTSFSEASQNSELNKISEEKIYSALQTVIDPELHINIVDLGLIYGLDIKQEKGVVTITMTLTTPGCPLSYVFQDWIPEAVKKVDGVVDVAIDLVWDPPWDPDKISDEQKEEMGIIK